MGIHSLDCDVMSIIFSFLCFRDAIKVCRLDRACYENYLIFCYRFSFVSLNMDKYAYHSRTIRKKEYRVQYDTIRYANCINNINSLDKLSLFIPRYLRYVSFGKHFNLPWSKKILPDTVEVITFHKKCKFNYNLSAINLPLRLRKITLGSMFDKPIDNLPASLEVIMFYHNSRFNQFIKRTPSSLRELYLGDNYDRPLVNLSASLKLLHFSKHSRFNNAIRYPPLIERVYFGKYYNRPLDDLLLCANVKISHRR